MAKSENVEIIGLDDLKPDPQNADVNPVMGT